MANLTSIARPYALAAFEYARDHQQLANWKVFLESAACVARNPTAAKLIANPEIASATILELFQEVLASQLDKERKNFLVLIAQHARFVALPDVADLFNAYVEALEKMSNVRVITAIDIQDDFRQKLVSVLTKRIQREVTLKCEVDPAILGGAIIHMGDRVIDGSVRGQLSRLLQNLTG
jgi:F-type H+-transporting ATPase subunit delta